MEELILNPGEIYNSSSKYFRLVSWNNGFALFEEIVFGENEEIIVIAEHVISTENGCSELDEL